MIAHAQYFVETAEQAIEAAAAEQHHASGRPLPEPSAPLTNGQKARLCILAREAFDDLVERGALEAGASFEDWRHDQQLKACGISSLRAATQRHYGYLVGHYKGLLGRMNQAMRAIERAMTEGRRLAMFKLREALAERGLGESYAAAICRRQFRRALAEASEKQLWCLVFTVRNRRKPVECGGSTPPSSPAGLTAGIPSRQAGTDEGAVKPAHSKAAAVGVPVCVPHDGPNENDSVAF